MSDGWVWMKCLGCGGAIRFIAYSGSWDLWSGTDKFVEDHISRCFGDAKYDPTKSEQGFSFFALVTEKQAYNGDVLVPGVEAHDPDTKDNMLNQLAKQREKCG